MHAPRHALLLPVTCVWLTACEQPSPPAAAPAAPPAASRDSAPVVEPAAESSAASGAIVIRARPGGDQPQQFCIPEWSIHNETGQSVRALLVDLHWQAPDGTRLDADTGYSALIEPLPANGSKRLTLNGYPHSCDTLTLVVGRYACRDHNAVRQPCPGPLKAESAGGVRIDLTAAVEGPMKGAMQAQ